jgi:pyrimidine operon attenuation protein/uracil phosphoribosyltransferase
MHASGLLLTNLIGMFNNFRIVSNFFHVFLSQKKMPNKTQILDAKQAEMKLNRIAYEIVENNLDAKELVLAGILDRGYTIASILKKNIEAISNIKIVLIQIQIDKEHPVDASIVEEFSAKNKTIIIVDDVANSGQTTLYATRLFLDELPKKIQIAVLVDRKHKRFPISSDYIGLMLSTTLQERIHVEVKNGFVTSAFLQ